jgi:hypothetical protein
MDINRRSVAPGCYCFLPRIVRDDRLHLTEPSGQASCAGCGKGFCRACHKAAGPKCGYAAAIA